MNRIKEEWLKDQKQKVSEPTLTAFHCTNCGKAMPIQSSEEQTCSACGTENILPESYQRLRTNKLQYERSQAAQQALYKRISKEPSRFLRVWTSVSDTLITLIGTFIALLSIVTGAASLVLLAMVYLIFHQIAPHIGISLIDVYGASSLYFVMAILLSILILLPMVLDSYFQDIVTLRKIVQASLSIRFPTHTEGQGACRNCSAPLEVKAGDVCVYCPYCETENLLGLGKDQLEKLKDFSIWHFKNAKETEEKEQSYLRESRSNLYFWFGGTLVLAIAAAGIGFILSWSDMEGIPTSSWSELQAHKKELFAMKTEFDKNKYSSLVLGEKYKTNLLAPYYWIALEKGENLSFYINEKSYLEDAMMRNTTDFDEAKMYHFLAWKQEAEGYRAQFTAPYKGIFCFMPPNTHVGEENSPLEIEVRKD